MRIGIMLRTLGEQGGIGVYSRHLTSELLALDRQNDYVLFYRNPEHAGRFAHFPNVVERVVRAPNKLLWDQASMPLAGRRERLDVLLHPKFSVPLAAPYKTVMVLHGAGWFMPSYQRYWKPQDLAYARLMMPLYCRRAASVLSVSKLTTEIFHQRFNLPKGKIRTVYFGPGRDFRPVQEPERLQQVRQKYRLPEHFIFSLSGYDRGPRKNIEGLLATYRLLHGRVPHQLIVGGRGCERFRKDFDIPNSGYGADILFPGWIEQEDLPVFYTLADLFLYPSRLEAFPIPITEALACGTPIVTSDANGMKELAGDAAVLVDPEQPAAIAEAAERVLVDRALHRQLSARSLARAACFSWQRCAQETLAILEEIGATANHGVR